VHGIDDDELGPALAEFGFTDISGKYLLAVPERILRERNFWECDGPARFLWHYGVDETIYILEGTAQKEYLGKTISLAAGDSLHLATETNATWTVDRYVKTTYGLDNPGRVVRVLRRLLASDT